MENGNLPRQENGAPPEGGRNNNNPPDPGFQRIFRPYSINPGSNLHPAIQLFDEIRNQRIAAAAAENNNHDPAGEVPVSQLGIIPPTPLGMAQRQVPYRFNQNEFYYQMRATMQLVDPIPGEMQHAVAARNPTLLLRQYANSPNEPNSIQIPYGIMYEMPVGLQTHLVFQPLDERAVMLPFNTRVVPRENNGEAAAAAAGPVADPEV